ncbi:MAG: DUF899 family protein [Gemmatimonadota bacterium]|nr:DUF899 family protein [Gemmatimonadota bacterium]
MDFPNESPEYRAARDKLLEMEIAERRATEALASARRELPPGGLLKEDYVFESAGADGALKKIKFSELFAPGKNSLILYNFMFPRDPSDDRPPSTAPSTRRLVLLEQPCPSCVALLDQLDGAAHHVGENTNFVVVAKTASPTLLAFGKERGWKYLRLLSSAGNSFKRDYHGEAPDGAQRPMLNVFHRNGGEIRHFWSSEMLFAPTDPGQDPRHVGMLEPLWNLFDFTRDGRPREWNEQLSYPG